MKMKFIFTLFLLVFGYKFANANESEWGIYTSKDKLTDEVSPPFLMYQTSMDNVGGKIRLKISCDNGAYGSKLNFRLVTYNLPSLLLEEPTTIFGSLGTEMGYVSPVRQLLRSKKVNSSIYWQDTKFMNVYTTSIKPYYSNYSDLPSREEFTFSNNKKFIIEYGDLFYTYAKKCFAGSVCYTANNTVIKCSKDD